MSASAAVAKLPCICLCRTQGLKAAHTRGADLLSAPVLQTLDGDQHAGSEGILHDGTANGHAQDG
jgi:hypothetical protein